MRINALVLGLLIFVAACDPDSPPAPPPPPPPTTTVTAVEIPVLPAEVAVIPLSGLGIEATAVTANVDSGTSGVAAAAVKIADGELRFIAPGDTGKDTNLTIQLRETDGDLFNVSVTVKAMIISGVSVPYDAPEEGSSGTPPSEQPALVITGVDGVRLTGGELKISVAGAAKLDPKFSSAYIIDAVGGRHLVSDKWIYDPNSNSFLVSPDRVAALRAGLPAGTSTMVIGLQSEDDTLAATYELTLLAGSAKLQGRVVNAAGVAVTTLTGRQIGIVGGRFGVRRVATIAADGSFAVDGLPPDTYEVQLLDLDFPGFVGGFFAIFTDGSTVTAEITYTGAGAGSASAASGITAQGAKDAAGQRSVGARASGTGQAPQRHSVGGITAQAFETGCSTISGDVTKFSISSGAENQTQVCNVQYVIEKGSSAVELKVTVTSAEYPSFTQNPQNPYNDFWSFAFSGAPTLPRGSGSVNSSHRNTGTYTVTACIDAATLARDNAVTITGALKAVNIGDSIVPTTVTAEFTLNKCGLQVTRANLSPDSKGGKITLIGHNGPTTGSPFLSIPQFTTFNDYGVPMRIEYAPKDAVLTRVEIGVLQGGTTVVWSDNILSQATTTKPGLLEFRDFIVPMLRFNATQPQLNLTVRLTGMVNGETVTSPSDQPNLTVNKSALFTPLFLAGEDPSLTSRRYGIRDNGGDSWATRATIDWLRGNSFRFDDISGLHVARVKSTLCAIGTRDVLQHCGHGNGQEVDLRYFTPDGTFTVEIGESGGPGLQALVQSSETGGPSSPATARLVQWILRNRAMFDAAAAEPTTLRIHFGTALYLARPLLRGRYPNGAPIVYTVTGMPDQTMDEWEKPEVVTSIKPHDTHWHITRRAV